MQTGQSEISKGDTIVGVVGGTDESSHIYGDIVQILVLHGTIHFGAQTSADFSNPDLHSQVSGATQIPFEHPERQTGIHLLVAFSQLYPALQLQMFGAVHTPS